MNRTGRGNERIPTVSEFARAFQVASIADGRAVGPTGPTARAGYARRPPTVSEPRSTYSALAARSS